MHRFRLHPAAIAIFLALGALVVAGLAGPSAAEGLPNGRFLISAAWLKEHVHDPDLVIVDVREPKYLAEAFIPGAVHMEWSQFQKVDRDGGRGVLFVGVDSAQQLLGRSGIRRTDRVVLYDAERRDGAATASYVFWVLELLGHPEIMVLERGFEAWSDAGLPTAATPRRAKAVEYRAPPAELREDRWTQASVLRSRLGDPLYQILDVRSVEEYLGKAITPGLDGRPLKAGHVPGAFNVDYTRNWSDPDRKSIKGYDDLQKLYAGLDPERPVAVYCLSGRRASFSYFILRLMGMEKIALYDASWLEWGNPAFSYPVETRPRPLSATDTRRKLADSIVRSDV